MCRRIKSFQVVVLLLSGTGAIPCRRRMLPTVWWTPDTPDWPMLPQSGRSPSRSSREPSEPPDPRSLDSCAVGRACGAVWSRRIFQPPVGDTRREWYRVSRCARLSAVPCDLSACRFPPGWPARHRRVASLAADAPLKCGSRPPGTHSAAGVPGLPIRSRRPKAAPMWFCSCSISIIEKRGPSVSVSVHSSILTVRRSEENMRVFADAIISGHHCEHWRESISAATPRRLMIEWPQGLEMRPALNGTSDPCNH